MADYTVDARGYGTYLTIQDAVNDAIADGVDRSILCRGGEILEAPIDLSKAKNKIHIAEGWFLLKDK